MLVWFHHSPPSSSSSEQGRITFMYNVTTFSQASSLSDISARSEKNSNDLSKHYHAHITRADTYDNGKLRQRQRKQQKRRHKPTDTTTNNNNNNNNKRHDKKEWWQRWAPRRGLDQITLCQRTREILPTLSLSILSKSRAKSSNRCNRACMWYLNTI